MAVLCLCFCVRAFSSCSKQGLLFVAVHGLLTAVTSLVAEHGLQAHELQQLWNVGSVVVACGLQSAGSVVVAHRLSCPAACGIFSDQGLNPCPLHDRRILNHYTTREVLQLCSCSKLFSIVELLYVNFIRSSYISTDTPAVIFIKFALNS